jgi:hypothetical protein
MGKELTQLVLTHTTEGAMGHYTRGLENLDTVAIRLRDQPEGIPANTLVSCLFLEYLSHC